MASVGSSAGGPGGSQPLARVPRLRAPTGSRNRKIAIYFLAFGVLGLTLSIIVHIAGLAGVDVERYVPAILILGMGVLVAWSLSITSIVMVAAGQPKPDAFGALRHGVPAAVRIALSSAFVYAAGNFIYFMAVTRGGVASFMDGQYVLQSHGHVIRILTEAQYHRCRVLELRGFSAMWILFYAVAAVGLYYAARELRKRRVAPSVMIDSGLLHR